VRILFSGLPYFGKKLVQDLNAIDPSNTYVFCDTYYSFKDKIRFLILLPFASRVVSFNGVASKSGSLNMTLFFRKKLIMQWHGSDVITLKESLKKNQAELKYLKKACSYTDAIWLKEELAELGVSAEILHFKHAASISSGQKFSTLDVVTYLAEDNEMFYGIQQIELLAAAFPELKFHVVGSSGKKVKTSSNIIFYGWVDRSKMEELLNTHPIFIRLTNHDGYSLSILEAIANGNYVLWNNPHPCVAYVKEDTDLLPVFRTLKEQVECNLKERLQSNIEWAHTNLNKSRILENYIAQITKAD
jgi:hypothetical protein